MHVTVEYIYAILFDFILGVKEKLKTTALRLDPI